MVKKIAERGYIFLVLALMYLPIIMVIIFSFSGSAHFTFNNGFTFDSYKELFTDAPQKLWESLLNTVIIAVISSVVATVMGRLILGHITFCTPYVVLSVMPRLMQMDPNIYEAALDLGASPIKALFKVVIPYILPGVLSGFAMAFTISLDDFIITQLNKGASTGIDTLSTYLYSSFHNSSDLRSYKKEGRKKEKINEKNR